MLRNLADMSFGNCFRSRSTPEDHLSFHESGEVGSSSGRYEELMSGHVPCPTCRGCGRIPKEDEAKLVALIPYGDERLKPRRTVMWVAVAVVVCAIIAALLVFFLIPREVSLSSTSPHLTPSYVYVNDSEEIVFLRFQNTYNLSNQNYVKVRGSNATMVAMYDTKIVGEVKDLQVFHVPLRSTVVIAIPMNITFGDDEGYLAKFCTGSSSWLHNIALSFTVTIETTYLNHVEQIARTSFQYVNCAPTATTTTTTTTTVAPATTQPTTDAGAT